MRNGSEKNVNRQGVILGRRQHFLGNYIMYIYALKQDWSGVSFSDDEFVIGPCRSTATHDNDKKKK